MCCCILPLYIAWYLSLTKAGWSCSVAVTLQSTVRRKEGEIGGAQMQGDKIEGDWEGKEGIYRANSSSPPALPSWQTASLASQRTMETPMGRISPSIAHFPLLLLLLLDHWTRWPFPIPPKRDPHRHNSRLFCDVWRKIHNLFGNQSVPCLMSSLPFSLPDRDPPTPTHCLLALGKPHTRILHVKHKFQMYHQRQIKSGIILVLHILSQISISSC